MNLDYKEKYLKYKNKYLLTKSLKGGIGTEAEKEAAHEYLFNIFTGKIKFDYITLFAPTTSKIKLFLNPTFTSKLFYLYACHIGINHSDLPSLLKTDRFLFYKKMLTSLIYNESQSADDFIIEAKQLQ